jgi:chemotaxis protein CheD
MWFGGLHTIILKPGEGYAGEKPSIVSTVLGSCVSVTMFCRNGRFGAICHSLLPEAASGTAGNEFRYVDSSMYAMLLHFDRRGVPREELEVKLFGGSDLLGCGSGSGKTVGRQNIETALGIIASERLALLASDVGGDQGRKLFFKPHTGEVFVKRLSRGLPKNR